MKVSKKLYLTLIVVLFSAIQACEVPKDAASLSNLPACIIDKIDKIKAESVWNPPASVWRYEYNGETVYYIPSRCCDIPSQLFDSNCNLICSPDGGFTGKGDGKCKDFFEKRTKEKLIWKDER